MVEKEIGFVGDITSINPQLLNTLVESGYLPVVASVAADPKGQALNVNADIAAGEVGQPQDPPPTPPRRLSASGRAHGVLSPAMLVVLGALGVDSC
jgi:hypothetical protein